MMKIFAYGICLLLLASAVNAEQVKDDIDKVTFIHYKGGEVKVFKAGKATCYSLMGYTWKTSQVPYVINPTGVNLDPTMDISFVPITISTSAETWDAQTPTELFNDAYSVDTAQNSGVLDGKNVIDFGMMDSGTIAETTIWFNKRTKSIVEFDMRFNNYFMWGDAAANSGYMDVQNIATHELGHAVGLNDLYTSSCSAVTMYGYSNYGDVSKRSLEPADITGLQRMYG